MLIYYLYTMLLTSNILINVEEVETLNYYELKIKFSRHFSLRRGLNVRIDRDITHERVNA